MNVGNFLKQGSHSIQWTKTETGAVVGARPQITVRTERIEVDFQLSTFFSCTHKIFYVLKESIQKTIVEVRELSDKANTDLTLDIKPGGDNRAVFYLKGNDMSLLATAKDALDKILGGENINQLYF